MVTLSNQLGTSGAQRDDFSEKFHGGGDPFQSENLYCRCWTLKQGSWSIKLKKKICNMVKGRLELFRKFIRFGGITCPLHGR